MTDAVPQEIKMEIVDGPIEKIDVPIDITNIKSIRCYNFGKCMKTCTRVDKHFNDKREDYKYTPVVMTEGVAATSAMCSAGLACASLLIFCCDSCGPPSQVTMAPCGPYTCAQTGFITSASCLGCTLLSLSCLGSIYLFNKCGSRCTRILGCHSFSKGFEDE